MKNVLFTIALMGAIIISGTTVVGQKQTNTVKTTTLNEKSDSILTNLDQRLSIVDSTVYSVYSKLPTFTDIEKMKALQEIKANRMDVVGLVATVFFFISCVVIVFLVFWFKHKNKQRRYNLMQQALEKGQPIPILEEVKPKREKNAFYYLKNGLIIGGIGLALIISAIVMGGENGTEIFFVSGLILAGIGTAFIIAGRIKKKEEQRHLNE